MAELRLLCGKLGCGDVQSYIQSGNLVFSAPDKPAILEAKLEESIKRRFGISIPVLVRTATEWSAYLKRNPFSETSETEANRVLLVLSKSRPNPDAVKGLRERAADGERIVQTGDALWIHFGNGMGRSKLSPAVLDRLVGSPVTGRNWRTVLKLDELASQSSVS